MLADRNNSLDLSALLEKESERRELLTRCERLKAQRNKSSEGIAVKKQRGENPDQEISAMRAVSDEIKRLDNQLREIDDAIDAYLLQIPNLPEAVVPRGKDASANKEIRRWGEAPVFAFQPQPHWVIGERLGMLDEARATKISGARFVIYRDTGARLERAIIQFMLDMQREAGYLEVIPPLLVNRSAMIGTGQLPKLENDMFKTSDEEYFLIPTAEVPVTNMHREEVIPAEQLPLRYVAYTPCFRKEAGSYGKDTQGIVRQHQFNKVELVKITTPDSSYQELENLVVDAERILHRLELHYRVVLLSTGDMSFASAKSYDLEVWHSGVQRFWEVSSCSNFEAFQARRMNMRFKDQEGKVQYCHTLNGSGLATSRLLPAIMECYQTEEGGMRIPTALQPYLRGAKYINPAGQLA